eukprot:scaffold7233_cov570-Prasinococcus_capsulatus_cf.AAC.11
MRQGVESYRNEHGQEHRGGSRVHLDDSVGELHDPRHEQARERKVNDNKPYHVVVPLEAIPEPAAVYKAHLQVIVREPQRIEEGAKAGIPVLLHEELCVDTRRPRQAGADQAKHVALDWSRQHLAGAAANLARCGTGHEQHQRHPLYSGQLALEEEAEKNACRNDLEVA